VIDDWLKDWMSGCRTWFAGELSRRPHEADNQLGVESRLRGDVRQQRSSRDVISSDGAASLRRDSGRDGQTAVRRRDAGTHHERRRRVGLSGRKNQLGPELTEGHGSWVKWVTRVMGL